jgi:hypothetical protein
LTKGLRKLAVALLGAVVRHSPAGSRSWGRAMLREMQCIPTDWAALRWAVGSTSAIFRYSLEHAWRDERSNHSTDGLLKAVAKILGGLALAVAFCVAVLAVCMLSITRLSTFLVPEWHLARMPWVACVSVLGMPETIFVIVAALLWRKRKIVSAGILACAVTLATHFILYVSAHG